MQLQTVDTVKNFTDHNIILLIHKTNVLFIYLVI